MIKPLAFGPVIRQYMMSGIPDEERYSPQGNFKEKGKGLFPSITSREGPQSPTSCYVY